MPVILVPNCDGHRAASAFGAGDDTIELLELLGREFDDIAHLLLDFLRGGTGVWSNDERVFDREL